jgi:hypothetical protein
MNTDHLFSDTLLSDTLLSDTIAIGALMNQRPDLS